MKTPFPAFRVQCWSRSSVAVYAVTVLEVDAVSETALCRESMGSTAREYRIGFDQLATTPERLTERLKPLLSAPPVRAPKTALAVKTTGKGGSKT
jgi:hypothetical protein